MYHFLSFTLLDEQWSMTWELPDSKMWFMCLKELSALSIKRLALLLLYIYVLRSSQSFILNPNYLNSFPYKKSPVLLFLVFIGCVLLYLSTFYLYLQVRPCSVSREGPARLTHLLCPWTGSTVRKSAILISWPVPLFSRSVILTSWLTAVVLIS